MRMRRHILAMEARANAARLTVTRLCQESGISRASWYRWKEDDGAPSVLVWEEIDRIMQSHENTDRG